MRNYAEFKGYRSRIEFDRDSGFFVQCGVTEDEPGAPEKLFLVADFKRDDIRQTTDDPILQRRRARA
jgi:hypothetical protein